LAAFISENLPHVERWDLLAYTNLGRPKYHRLERAYTLEAAPLPRREHMEAMTAQARKRVSVARWSGATCD
jgi:pyruvate-formate lyase-activating enzyme